MNFLFNSKGKNNIYLKKSVFGSFGLVVFFYFEIY